MYSLLLRASDSLILSLFFVIEQMILFFFSERDQYCRRLFFVGFLFREHQRLIFVVFEEVRFLVYKESDFKVITGPRIFFVLVNGYSLCLLTMYRPTSFTICAWSNL